MQKEVLQKILERQFYPKADTFRTNREIRQLREKFSPYVKRYNNEQHTPELIEAVNKVFWKQAGFGDLDFQCNLTLEEINSIEKRGRMVLLIHPEIIEPKGKGLVKLVNAFPWTRDSWITDIDKVKKITHNSSDAGYVDVEANYNTPVYKESEFEKEIEVHGRIPQRLTTYIPATLFSLLYRGHPLDINNTSSILLGSFFHDGKENKVFIATWNESEKSIDIFFSKGGEYSPALGVRTEKVHIKTGSHVLATHLAGHKAMA